MMGEFPENRMGFSSLMGLRPAATSGVGFRHLARKDSRTAGIYGAGGQALHKVLALQNERPIATYKVYSRNRDNRQAFCKRMAAPIDAEVIPAHDPREAMKGARVVVWSTSLA